MLAEPTALWLAAGNAFGWLAIQLGLAWAFGRLPEAWFSTPAPFGWERAGRCYVRWCGVRYWTDRLPDGARWFAGGFSKARLASREAAYLARFARETWRGELCHWCAMAFAPLFFPWNPWWGDLVITVYAVAANLPCIIAQRYNRARIYARQRPDDEWKSPA